MLNAILLLYHHPPVAYAPTVMDSVNSFAQYSQFKVYSVNTYLGYPKLLDDIKFKVIILHYSMFGSANYFLSSQFLQLLDRSTDSYKIAVWQDECYNFRQRANFANRYKIDCVYTILDPKYFDEVYFKRCPSVKKVFQTLTGYVSEQMVQKATQFEKPYKERTVDVGYRARQVPSYLGLGGQEKIEIADKFSSHANGLGLNLDIKYLEEDRIYGDKYWSWLGNLKAILGAESGGSIFDLDSEVYDEWRRRQGKVGNLWVLGSRQIPYAEMPPELIKKYENKIQYRAISPRYFEAAAFRICQVLYLGEYNGILKPWVHYLPLERDFANFHQIIKLMQNEKGQEVRADAYKDLIASGKYTFQKFIESFDEELIKLGLNPQIDQTESDRVNTLLNKEVAQLTKKRRLESLVFLPYYAKYPGKRFLMPFAGLAGGIYFKLKGYKKGAI